MKVDTALAYGNVVEFWSEIQDIAGWKIWYGDGTMACSKDISWQDAPDQNVQLVMLYQNRPDSTVSTAAIQKWKSGDGKEYYYRRVLAGVDFYTYHSALGHSEVFNDISKVSKGAHIKYGKEIDIEEFKKIRKKAQEDLDL